MGKIARGWKMTKMSLRIVRKDKHLLIFPILSGLFTALILVGFVVGMFYSIGIEAMFEATNTYTFLALTVVVYFLSYFISIYFNAAVIGCAMIRLDGRRPTLGDGFRVANQNIGRILAWALFTATVGLVLRTIQEKVGIFGKIVVGLIGVAWALGTFFVVPVLIFEKVGPLTAMKRSAVVFKGVWGETFVGGMGIGVIFFLAGLLGVPMIVLGLALGGETGLFIGVGAAAVYWIALAVVASAAASILTAALYRFATTGKVSREFGSRQLFENPWRY